MSRDSILERLADQHEARINKVLYTLEDDIVSSIVNSTKNNVVSTQIAIQLRPQLKALIEKNFLKEADAVIRDYDKVVDEFMKEFGVLNIPDEFKTLTQANLETITALKYQTFRGFEDVAGRFLNVIGDEVYQSAIAGKPFNETVKAIRGAINGVYQRSNEEAINRLTRYIDLNRYSSDPLKVARVKEARKILHTKYASDILGNNMRRYAGQIAHDSLMQFDGSFILSKAKEAGLNKFKYSGSLVTDSRDFCRRNQGRTFTQDEANKEWQRSWSGKSSSDPFTARGGYRCRHHWLVVTDIVEEKKPEAKPKPKPKPKPKSVSNITVINSARNYSTGKYNESNINNVLGGFKGQEKSVDLTNKFINSKNIVSLFLDRQMRLKPFRKKHDTKISLLYQKTHNDSLPDNALKPPKRANGYMMDHKEFVVVTIDDSIDFATANSKKIQDHTETILLRTKENKGRYTTKITFEKNNADWSFSTALEADITMAERRIITYLHEVGHQAHFWASKETGIATMADVFAFAGRKNINLTNYASSNADEYHAELKTKIKEIYNGY